jgi:DUF4097 and DUF4098 domain-containing protein YvlB
LLTLAAAARGAVEGSFDRNLNVTGPVDLSVSTGSGAIAVRTGNASAVRIHGLIRANNDRGATAEEKVRFIAANPPIEQTGNTIRIGHIEDDRYRNVSISYELEVPAETRLHARTGSGEQSVDGIRGPAQLSTGSGGISARNIGNEIEAKTGSGDIEVENIRGGINASTGSGSISGGPVAGSISATAGSGSVKLQQSAPGDVLVRTGSGTVELSGVEGSLRVTTGSGGIRVAGEPAGEWKLSAGSGGIDLLIPADAAFDLNARTQGGRVRLDRALTSSELAMPKEVRGKVAGGGALVEVRTGSGDIQIK